MIDINVKALSEVGIAYLPWDSSHFGVRIARVEHEVQSPETLAAQCEVADRIGIDCLYYNSDFNHVSSMAAAARCRFMLVDIKTDFEHSVSGWYDSDERPPESSISRADEMLAQTAAYLAAMNHRNTRFYRDSHFDREKADDLYSRWIQKAFEASLLYVLHAGKQIKGYITIEMEAPPIARIGLIGVHPEHTRQGVAGRMLRWLLQGGAGPDNMSLRVATQAGNIAAHNLYSKYGFQLRSVKAIFHRWRG